jgi:DNA-binding SARP family transcriptional activator/DNA-binding CsgD family transcriptional regulator
VRVRLLGPVDIAVDGDVRPVRGGRSKAVLAVLALHHGQVVGTDRLIEAVWGEQAASVAANTLQSHVSYLRRLLRRPTAIVARPPGYLLELGDDGTDAQVAERLIRDGQRSADPTERARRLSAALALWRGPALADVTGNGLLQDHAERLGQLRLQARRNLIDARMALGEHRALIPELEQLVRDHPFDEQLHGQLMVALYRAGRQVDALASYRRLRQVLHDDLGIEPSPALRTIEAGMLRQDPALAAPVESAAATGPRPLVVAPVAAGGLRLGGAPVVGRTAEMATLRAGLAAASHGSGGAVFLTAEAGLGKTRLAEEAGRLADEAGLRVLRGRAASPAVQFRPLSEALLAELRRSGAPTDPELRPYRPALSRLVPEWRLDRLAGVDDSPIVLAEAVLRLVVTLGRPHGCLLVLEDLHEADADTLAVVDYLVDNVGREPVLLLGTVRTDANRALDLVRAAGHRRSATVLMLDRIDDEAVRRLAAGCLEVAPEEVPAPVVERLWKAADGVPLHVEELLAGMVGDGVLVRAGRRWRLAGPVPPQIPVSLAATLVGRTDRVGPHTRRLLRAAALLGRRFDAPIAATSAGITDSELLSCLREAVEAHLLVPCADAQTYAFRHALTAEALRARTLPAERAALARRAAEAVEASALTPFPGWERLAGELWHAAGEIRRAGELLGAAGRRAVAQGALSTGVELLERALSMVDTGAPDAMAGGLAEALVDAYADAGRVADAYEVGARFVVHVAAPRQAAMRLRLARVAAAAGDWERGLREVSEARRLLGPRADLAVRARIDAVAARLTFGRPTPQRRPAAQRLAARALRAAEATNQPDVACSALQTLGRCARLRDLAEADALYARGLAIAEANDLVAPRLSLLNHIGAHDGIRAADPGRLRAALTAARRVGAVVTALDIEIELTIVQLCRGEYDAAEAAARRCEERARRLRLTHTQLIALGERIMVAAHRARRAEVDHLLADFRALGGEEDDVVSAVRGFGLAIGHLLHEDMAAARAELEVATAYEAVRPTSYLSYVSGPALLVAVLTGGAGRADCAAMARSAQVQAGWNRQFLHLARAVLADRAGRHAPAVREVAEFLTVSRPYPLARHLGLRLIAPLALHSGWGEPIAWLRTAEAYFHTAAPEVGRACRTVLRRAGAPVPQHREGSEAIPLGARQRGITVREYEILRLVGDGLGNRDIGQRLFLSPRTVEKHVTNLLAKTGIADRGRLAGFAAAVGGPSSAGR